MSEKELYNQLEEYDKEIIKLSKEIKELKSILDKAIDYIENIEEDKDIDGLFVKKKEKSFLNFLKIKNDLLKILKGEENDN
jgi:predicted nucleotidyltransferase